MDDVVFVAIVVAFFAIAVAYVRGCGRIIGGDGETFARVGDDHDRADTR